MKSTSNKIIIFSLFIALANLLAIGCFFTSQGLMNKHDNPMTSMECCNMGTYNFSEHAGYNLQYNLNDNNYPLLNVFLFFSLVVFLTIKETNFLNYYLAKDRYGGFKLFNKFTLLFKTGILQPKLY